MIPREEYGMDLLWWRWFLDDLAPSNFFSCVDVGLISRYDSAL